jgi:hypothetical protein
MAKGMGRPEFPKAVKRHCNQPGCMNCQTFVSAIPIAHRPTFGHTTIVVEGLAFECTTWPGKRCITKPSDEIDRRTIMSRKIEAVDGLDTLVGGGEGAVQRGVCRGGVSSVLAGVAA